MLLRQLCRRHSRLCCYFSSESPSSSKIEDLFPPKSFLKEHVRNNYQRSILARRISELQLFHKLRGSSSLRLDESAWKLFFEIKRPDERVSYLIELDKGDSDEKPIDEVIQPGENRRLISEVNQERYDNGEMVYAPGFHSLLDIRGQEFRKQIDSLFGSRLIAQTNCADSLPKMVVDCRFLREYSVKTMTLFISQLQDLHDRNWSSRRPFDVSIANYVADSQLADISKRLLLFRYGPRNSENAVNFCPHIFAPTMSSRGVREVAGCERDSIMYISWRATKFLPEKPPSDVKAVVLCASNDYQPWSSSLSAATTDKLPVYRIPVESHVRLEGKKRILSLSRTSDIMRSYFSGDDLGAAIRSAYTFYKSAEKEKAEEENKIILEYTTHVVALENEHRAKMQQKSRPFVFEKPTVRKHKYSREDRRKMREAEAMA